MVRNQYYCISWQIQPSETVSPN